MCFVVKIKKGCGIFENLLKSSREARILTHFGNKIMTNTRFYKLLSTAAAVYFMSYAQGMAATVVASGNDCGANCSWTLDSTGKLTITGTGAMADFSNRAIAENNVDGNYTTSASYGDYWNQITSIEIGEGITSTGERAFQGLSNVTSVSIPQSLESTSRLSFDRMSSMISPKIKFFKRLCPGRTSLCRRNRA